jgi:hypothetical protein
MKALAVVTTMFLPPAFVAVSIPTNMSLSSSDHLVSRSLACLCSTGRHRRQTIP